MIIILGLAVFFSVALLVWILERENSDFPGMAATISGLLFCLAMMCMVGNRAAEMAHVVAFRATQATMEMARANKNINPLELAALQRDVINQNQWLAHVQYFGKNPWTSWFVPESVQDLKPIQ